MRYVCTLYYIYLWHCVRCTVYVCDTHVSLVKWIPFYKSSSSIWWWLAMNSVTMAVWQYLRNISSRITSRRIECPPDAEASNRKNTESMRFPKNWLTDMSWTSRWFFPQREKRMIQLTICFIVWKKWIAALNVILRFPKEKISAISGETSLHVVERETCNIVIYV